MEVRKTEVQTNLERFFEEKEIPYKEWAIEHNGQLHFIDNDFIKELILTKTKTAEQKKIRDILTMIDFKNGDVNHFLEHLANGYIKTHY